ncbi:AGAP003754-PA-like protein [Anopheles sinensis]|uniref:AGAP003754-PA-like protein n=1 Tax=Anopheles sinensis TaxID=74873 RepID=A0A084WQ99_ANOSI|nr:AGAP003754-PA-like protein [Anopheles sinensis]
MSANVGEKSCETPGAMKSILKKGSKVEAEEPAPTKDTNVSLKRKKVSEKMGVTGAGTAPGGDQPADPMSESYASVVKQAEKEVEHASQLVQPVPSSAALGNHSKANGKRLKLDIKTHTADQTTGEQPVGLLHGEKVTVVRSKPPIPPKPDVRTQPQRVSSVGSAGAPNLNGRETKGKKQQVTEAQTAHTVQKLLAQNEQMRLELSELRSNLAAERNAVRVLRAQNESDLRKTKAECKKLQEALQHQKRNAAVQCQGVPAGGVPPAKRAHRGPGEQETGAPMSPGGPGTPQHQCNLEVLKLNQEISALRETNKFLEEKYLISSEAERRKASDIRVQRDLHELRLTQLSKSAKNEIQRLLEELKSKERSIAQLKKELQAAQTSGGCRKERGKAAKNSAQQSHECFSATLLWRFCEEGGRRNATADIMPTDSDMQITKC